MQTTSVVSTYTAAEVLTIVAALGVLVSSIGGVIVTIIGVLKNGQATKQVDTKVDAALTETKSVAAKVDQVHTLTNSNLSAVKAELAQSVAQIAMLASVIQDLKAQRSKQEITEALQTPAPVQAVAASSPMVTDKLDKIETYTGETARNTARTDATVQNLKDKSP